MKRTAWIFLSMTLLFGCDSNDKSPKNEAEGTGNSLFGMENLVAWCIIPYDSKERTPRQRAEMLNELGFSRMAYDWREEHLPQFPEEIETLNQHRIHLEAAWLWVDQRASDGLLPEHDRVFDALDATGTATVIWLGIDEGFYEGLQDSDKIEKIAGLLHHVHERASVSGSRVALYNHGGWIGVPENQVRTIEASGLKDIGIVYNF
ncbi:hypothetical protein QLX67_12655, partial [Balneolaceae bacterium ANBcel3]|nr:hypothetical protein [Balneolaceae bacterium ANBcel3]